MKLTFQPKNQPNPGLVVIGAGPAGLSAAYTATTTGKGCTVLEQSGQVGGLARTQSYKGFAFDIGGHRFFSEISKVSCLWEKIMGESFLSVSRASRICCQGRFYQYPLEFLDALTKLGPVEGIRILFSFARAKIRPTPNEDTFEKWVVNRFGRHLYHTFFKSYSEKVWGIGCDRLCADWAAQRIQGLNLTAAIWNSMSGQGDAKTLIDRFNYPSGGAGMMWQKLHGILESKGCQVRLHTKAMALTHDGGRITGVRYEDGTGKGHIPVDQVISSAPLTTLVSMLEPAVPQRVRAAVNRLSYRAFVQVVLIIQAKDIFPDQWIYIHDPDLKVARIQNFKNWSPDMVPDPAMTSLGMEYFCNEGDDLWTLADKDLIALAVRECSGLDFIKPGQVTDGVVIRQPKAYPVYDEAYAGSVGQIQNFINKFDNLETIGRNGMHRYNNMDESMLSGMMATGKISGRTSDLWPVKSPGAVPGTEPAPLNRFKTAAGL